MALLRERNFGPLIVLLLVLALPGAKGRAQEYSHDHFLQHQISVLVAALRSPDPQTRRNAASALSRVKPLPPDAIPAVTQALKDSDCGVQQFAIYALANTGVVAIPALKALLEDKEPRNLCARRVAIYSLCGMAKKEPATWPVLVGAFDDPSLQPSSLLLDDAFADPGKQQQVWPSLALAKVGAPVVPLLRRALLDKNLAVRRGAVAALQMAPGTARDATPELIAALKDSDQWVRKMAAMDLGRIGAPARSALPALAAALSDPLVCEAAAVAMARIDPTDKAPVPTLIGALVPARGLSNVQDDAVRALGGMGGNAREAIPALKHLLTAEQYPWPRIAITGALRAIVGADALPALLHSLAADPEVSVRLAVLNEIKGLGPGATAAIPGLVSALRDPDRQVRTAAADRLAGIGKPATPALIEALGNPDLYIREGAVRALSKSKPLPDDVAHALIAAASDDKSAIVRDEAANVLAKAGVKGGLTLAEKAQDAMSAMMGEPPDVDTKRVYRRQEIFADIAPDNNNEYPLRLIYLLSLNDGKMLATVYRGQDQSDRLIFWSQSGGDDRYRQIEADEAGQYSGGGRFDAPNEIFISGVQYVGVGENVWRNNWVDFFRVDGDEMRPVKIDPPEKWYRDKLRPGGEIANQSESGLSDVDTERLYRRQEIFADIPAEKRNGHALQMVYLLSFYGDQMLAAVYRGPGHADRLIFWKQSGKDRYQQTRVIDAGDGGTFDPPKEMSLLSTNGNPGAWLVDVGVNVQRAHWDDLFADGDVLRPVEIESPEEWYSYRMKKGEKIVGPSESWFFIDSGKTSFSLDVRSGRRTNRVVGTYKLVEPGRFGGGMIFVYPGISSPEPEQIWKLVPDSARIEPLQSH